MKINKTNKKVKIFACILLIFSLTLVAFIHNIISNEYIFLEIAIVIISLIFFLCCILHKNEYSIFNGKIKWEKGVLKKKQREIELSNIKAIIFTKVANVRKYTFEIYKKNKQGNFIYKVFAVENYKKHLMHLNDLQIYDNYEEDFYIELNFDNEFEALLNEKINAKIYIQKEDYEYLKQILDIYISKNLIASDDIIIV